MPPTAADAARAGHQHCEFLLRVCRRLSVCRPVRIRPSVCLSVHVCLSDTHFCHTQRTQDVKDNSEEAAKVAPQTLGLCQMVRVTRLTHVIAAMQLAHAHCMLPVQDMLGHTLQNSILFPFCQRTNLLHPAPTQQQRSTQNAHTKQLEAADCWEDAIDGAIASFEAQHRRRATYTICYY